MIFKTLEFYRSGAFLKLLLKLLAVFKLFRLFTFLLGLYLSAFYAEEVAMVK